MELNFGENIKRLRKNCELTQEALADALGVSAQSVSKWECAYGYPDITQLPAIANYFGVTIDELLSNDEYGKKQAEEYFEAHIDNLDEASEEKIAFLIDYCRRYPEEPYYAYVLCTNISCHITQVCPENRDKYYSLLVQAAEKLIDNVNYRGEIATEMIKVCPKEELDKWLKFAAYSAKTTRRNCLIERYNVLKDYECYRIQLMLDNLESIAIQLNKTYPDSFGPSEKAMYQKKILDIIASFGKERQIPDGWLSFYAHKQFVYSACLFQMGKANEGKCEFLSAVEKLRKYYSLTEEYLDMGSSLFSDVRVNKEWLYAIDKNGEKHRLYGTAPIQMFGDVDYTLGLLTNSRWAWFDSARNENYYKDTVKWLKGLAEKPAD